MRGSITAIKDYVDSKLDELISLNDFSMFVEYHDTLKSIANNILAQVAED